MSCAATQIVSLGTRSVTPSRPARRFATGKPHRLAALLDRGRILTRCRLFSRTLQLIEAANPQFAVFGDQVWLPARSRYQASRFSQARLAGIDNVLERPFSFAHPFHPSAF